MNTGVGQPARFLLIGIGGYVVNVGLFALLYGLGLAYILASILSYFLSNAMMYVGNRYFTFRLGHEGFWRAYLSYMLVGGIVIALTAGCWRCSWNGWAWTRD